MNSKEGVILALDRARVKAEVVDIEPFSNEKYCGFTIHWVGNIGFGEYTIYKAVNTNEWHADSELMDEQGDTWFLDPLLNDFKQRILKID